MTDTMTYGQLAHRGNVMASSSVGYPDGPNWNLRWLQTTTYLNRLREVYQGKPANNIDLMALVDAFMIGCAHMWDAFRNDPALPSIGEPEVDAAMNGDQNLRLCRDYANTTKHLVRNSPAAIQASVLEAGSKGTGNFVTIGYGPSTNPHGSTIDALDLAEAAYAAWQAFMIAHNIKE